MRAEHVFRESSGSRVLSGTSLIDAVREPPPSRDAQIFDDVGALASACPRETWRWRFTPRGEGRMRAEAEGWLRAFLDGRAR